MAVLMWWPFAELSVADRRGGLSAVLPGHRASSTLWIHNTTGVAASSLRVHGSELVSHNRDTIPDDAWRFEPTEIDIAPPG